MAQVQHRRPLLSFTEDLDLESGHEPSTFRRDGHRGIRVANPLPHLRRRPRLAALLFILPLSCLVYLQTRSNPQTVVPVARTDTAYPIGAIPPDSGPPLARPPPQKIPTPEPIACSAPAEYSVDLGRWEEASKWNISTFCNEADRARPPRRYTQKSGITYAIVEGDQLPREVELFKLRPVTSIPANCIESYMSTGAPCPCTDVPRIDAPLDLVWTWVNGSDHAHQTAIAQAEKDSKYIEAQPKHYRDHDELRYSLRSALQHFGNKAGQFRILAADMVDPENPSKSQRLGQTPQFLQVGATPQSSIALNIQHHSDFFSVPGRTSFNSFAIESEMSTTCNITENFVYMNDDYFLSKDMDPADFYSPEHGPVLRFQDTLLVTGRNPPKAYKPASEWLALEHSNWLLDQRFGERKRPYLSHLPKVLQSSIIHEMKSGVWPEVFASTSKHVFRGRETDSFDVHTSWLHANYLVERSREALLWTWIVGKLGGGGDEWTEATTMKAWAELGGNATTTELAVDAHPRWSLAFESNAAPANTKYMFSSQDGYAFGFLVPLPQRIPPLSTGTWFSKGRSTQCNIMLDQCLRGKSKKASHIFAQVAFKDVHCGDCIIRALISSSGRRGVAAFLPPKDRVVSTAVAKDMVVLPRLPLHANHGAIDWSLRSVIGSTPSMAGRVSVREWTMMAIQRYRHVIGTTPSDFIMIVDVTSVRRAVEKLDRNTTAMFCFNDDVDPRAALFVDKALHEYLQSKWPLPAPWEKV